MSLLHAGLDIGSTTAKAVVIDDKDEILYSCYRRHFSDIKTTISQIIDEIRERFGSSEMTFAIAGSGALGMAEGLGVPFAQELIACSTAVERTLDKVDVAIELGGEDAKITFFDRAGVDQRMNETCAGGTGAFIDQMAVLLGTDASGLNEMAKSASTIYPIASRCGVFAKTDIQPLLNDGASKPDLAVSIFQAIVNQTISGLACGRKIKGHVAFLGGPLFFLSQLRERFVKTLELTEDEYIFPENPHLFVAIGAALIGARAPSSSAEEIAVRAKRFFSSYAPQTVGLLPPLFPDAESRKIFSARHSAKSIARADISTWSGDAYLGIDVGSTTIKVVLIGGSGELLFSRYRVSNAGEPVRVVRECLMELFAEIGPKVRIAHSGVTGYGEKLIAAAFGIDIGEVETVAHARAADFMLPGADFVIDIGGQDMKCLGIENGIINRVFLNEACSSGCGSFLQTFAESLGISVAEFAKLAEESTSPVDLGSRCTVFMNSRVKQAQKEGASVADISSGLVYSIVKNALYKVLKIRSMDDIGDKIVVQGGTFKNDALLRAFELVTGKEVVRPEISELMGAFGIALIARDAAIESPDRISTLRSRDEIERMNAATSTMRCGGCGNNCILTRTIFDDGRRYISGNRCERGAGGQSSGREHYDDLYAKKFARLFDHYSPLRTSEAPRGTIGIPRVLNMYDDYPFWFTLFTELGFRVELSSSTPDEKLGIDTIPSQTLCYPAKLVHRHIEELLVRGIKRIFYPIIQQETREFKDAHKTFNCPVVAGYPDAAYLNIEDLHSPDVDYMRPSLPLDLDDPLGRTFTRLKEELCKIGVSSSDLKRAVIKAAEEQKNFKADIRRMGDEALAAMKERGGVGIVLTGHPYHLDPVVNHGIPEAISEFGVTVFTEDSICHHVDEIDGVGDLYVVDQWVFHSRLYRAAAVIAKHPDFKDVHMIQLNSFGCGLDAITADQTAEILHKNGKLHTLIKIDESNNNGAIKIRIRSLLASVRKKKKIDDEARRPSDVPAWKKHDRSSLAGRTILCPPLSSFHFQFVESMMRDEGVDFRVLPEGGRDAVDLALKYVNNDACYPSMFVVGQFLKAFEEGSFDLETTDCLYAQTGGACRASNYVPLLRRALDAAGLSNVRILAVNAQANDGASPMPISMRLGKRVVLSMLYGDMLMKLVLATRPYEKESGAADRMHDHWAEIIKQHLKLGKLSVFKKDLHDMARDFDAIPVDLAPKPKVGIVGEILVKYHCRSNEHLVSTIEQEGGEAVVPDITNFVLYSLMDNVFSRKLLDGSLKSSLMSRLAVKLIEWLRGPMRRALEGTRFSPIHTIDELAEKGSDIVSLANQAGEGWLLTAEMVSLLESGVNSVICVQPFACLPNHITGKGVVKELKRRYEHANILPLDFDSSVSNVNQLNRIKLLMATAR